MLYSPDVDWSTELATLLRPSAGGVHLVSTGRAAQARLQRQLYGVDSDEGVRTQFLAAFERLADARGVILGIPSDVGAGFVRGANLGPQVKLIRRLGTEIGMLGGDIMEVAPPLRQVPRGAHKTTVLAARYFWATMAATLGL